MTPATPAEGLAVPRATYRLQFNNHFTFADALAVVPYLAALGISHVYASPFLKARPGSEHGYDIVDHNAINPEIGGWDGFVRFSDALRAHGMGLILDFVPNHMGIGKADNAWWLDVLEWGQGSIYADFFDIDWTPFKPELRGKLLLPLLGDHYGLVLVRGELSLRFDEAEGSLSVWYHDHRLPLRPRSYAPVLRRALANSAGTALAPERRAAFERLAEAFDRVRRVARRRRKEARRRYAALKAELAALCRGHVEAAFMAEAAATFNGQPGSPDSFRPLHALLERQHYRPAFWRVAADEVNYRRFFNINELAGIRMEGRALFDAAHGLVGRMIADGRLNGLRLDHIDGLFDPEAYCRRLQAFAHQRMPRGIHGDDQPFYIVVEKILAHHESLRASWPIAGTTGYEFVNLVNGLFVDAGASDLIDAVYRQSTGTSASFDDVLLAAKDTVIETLLSAELNVLATELDRISERHWATRDYTRQRLYDALKEIVRHFPVYRTYVTTRKVSAEDRRDIDWAVSQARRSWRGPDGEIFDFVHDALTGDLAKRGKPFDRADVLRFAMRFQQYTGPVMAKSMEDTAFYRHSRLISLNEVGGDPRQFGSSVAAFHQANRQRARQWPHAMLATSTHDTKRGEDARLRIDVLSEMPEEWSRRVQRWSELNQFLRREINGRPAPAGSDEYLLYQTLVGTWHGADLAGLDTRIQAYWIKALREAKRDTSWDDVNAPYEDACSAFARGLLDVSRPNPFLDDFAAFAERIAWFGMLSSLAQTALRLTAPGVPDTYQGTELWDLNLVDPDNRRPVDFARRRRLLEDAKSSDAANDPLAYLPDGSVKLRAIRRLLQLRRAQPGLFRNGSYEPVVTVGARADHLVAFLRRDGDAAVLVLGGRLFVSLLGAHARSYSGRNAWGDTEIASRPELRGQWRDALSGARFSSANGGFSAAALLARLPAAVLAHEPEAHNAAR